MASNDMTDKEQMELREIFNYCRVHYGSNGISDEYEEELASRLLAWRDNAVREASRKAYKNGYEMGRTQEALRLKERLRAQAAYLVDGDRVVEVVAYAVIDKEIG